MKNIYYPAIFHPEEIGYSVSVPDIEGCFTQGNSMDEAVEMAQDAIGLMLEDRENYPVPSVPASIELTAGDFVVVVPFNWVDYKRRHDNRAVKKNTVPPLLAERGG